MKLTANRTILINREELLCVRKLITNYNSIIRVINSYLESDKENFEVPLYFVRSISEELDERVGLTEKYIVSGVNEKLEDLFKKKVKEYRSTKTLDELVSDDIEKITQSFYLVEEILSISNELYKLRDYSRYIENVVSSISYFCSNEFVEKVKKEYQEAIESSDLNKMIEIVNKAQELILQHWQEFVTDVDSYTGGKYNFICHSTDSTRFDGDFFTKYVSCSLLNENLTDTYRCGFGFIMSPKDIVAASSSDMYVINSSENEERLFSYTSVKKLDGPEKIIDEALEMKRKDKDEKVYTEVVVQGFHPLAIFCLSDGSKMLNYNYRSALKLKECYPDLKVIVLDITKNKTDEELNSIKRGLIKRIRQHLNYTEITNNSYYEAFDLFWIDYQELIKKSNYTEEDIVELFNYHSDLISIFLDERKLFENYDSKTIKHILYYNYKFRIIDIINGNYNMLVLDRLYENLSSFKSDKRLEEIIPGITIFLRLYPNVILSEDDKYEICSFNNLNDINNFLSYILHNTDRVNPTFETDDTIYKFLNKDINITNLLNLYRRIKSLSDAGRVNLERNDINLFLKIFSSIKIDDQTLEDFRSKDIHSLDDLNDILLDNLSRQKLTIDSKIRKYESKISTCEEQLDKKIKEKEKYEKAVQCQTHEVEYVIAQKDYNDIKEEINHLLMEIKNIEREINIKVDLVEVTAIDIESLNNHRIMNRRKINNLLNSKQSLSNDIEKLRLKLKQLNMEILKLKDQLRIVVDDFKKKTGLNLQEYSIELASSKNILESISIEELIIDINSLTKSIDKLKSLLFKYKDNKEQIEVLEGEKSK